jgi:hypothetical protein
VQSSLGTEAVNRIVHIVGLLVIVLVILWFLGLR